MLVEEESLWGKVFKAKYDILEFGEQPEVEGRMSNWWKDFLRTCFQNQVNEWFDQGAQRVIGDGRSINFWQHIWLGTKSFQNKFSRLYNPSLQSEIFQKWIIGLGVLGIGIEGGEDHCLVKRTMRQKACLVSRMK